MCRLANNRKPASPGKNELDFVFGNSVAAPTARICAVR